MFELNCGVVQQMVAEMSRPQFAVLMGPDLCSVDENHIQYMVENNSSLKEHKVSYNSLHPLEMRK